MLKRAIVTGHTGFIGQALTRRLRDMGYEVFGLSASSGHDVTDAHVLETVPADNVRHVFHLAGRTFVPESWENPSAFYRTNTLGTQNVLDYCRTHALPMTFASAYLYGQPRYLPIDEGHPLNPNNPYAHSKFLAEELCRFYAEQYGVRVTIARPFNVYGPGQDARFLIPSIIRQALHSDSIILQDMSPRRDYVYIDDLIDAFCCFFNQANVNIEYNIGLGSSYSISEIVTVILKVTKKKVRIVCTSIQRKNEIFDTVADITRMYQDFGWRPQCMLESGITAIYKEYL
jgi:nucleoside-diphosphate-sugar epimerase